ncbi:hypothetical protein BL250_01120 [Erwinia sp. OLTSP20]|uniref:fructosamine kinase family protein n=1 Tax=unclassified Erwinia TaxID=2622719 RepID=UPI000C18F50E|nr:MULTISPECIES: phosphotransferase [unclassified Erwinia]PIJ51328.1 hypothetical protein BV501_04655 [Erwinia sp. OAMSP11]PIJ74113.1 hypothetical protein BK416_04945 [Erwinia sp. OLSSP12]PIJ79790.1 hypothetical protein BLD47_12815 [Erwinia sp. OLCASP19]PIJ86076.1 hypothetical protein BLD46_04740 [Erwinia sp. OLMTSP26]PIJ87825.1 hypothetical protein BLD49_04740 [Erwinia sp. OLMDSP33]
MESQQLQFELALVLGETLSRIECISEQPWVSLYTIYDASGNALPLIAKCFSQPGFAAQEAKKLSLLARQGKMRVPAVFGMVLSHRKPLHETLLVERLGGIPIEVPARSPTQWQALQAEIIEGILRWHRTDSHGQVGTVDSIQENQWSRWYLQRIEVLWAMLNFIRPPILTMDDRQVLYRARQQAAAFFNGFDDPCVLVHGNLTLQHILKTPRSERLLAAVNPGTILWAPREFDLFRLWQPGAASQLLTCYVSRAPVNQGFLWRRWLYALWESIDHLMHTGGFDRALFDHASQSLLPWLGDSGITSREVLP